MIRHDCAVLVAYSTSKIVDKLKQMEAKNTGYGEWGWDA